MSKTACCDGNGDTAGITPEAFSEAFSETFRNTASMSGEMLTAFRRIILDHYHATPRPMPWRSTDDAYHILVSEVMLQQTQVERVRDKYTEFLAAFPTPKELAGAQLSDVLRVWQGLGYNRRAVALHRCAAEIMARFDGQLPETVSELQSLPGIGHYTACAVAVFAFGTPAVMIETNIRTVFIHFFFHGRDLVSDNEIMPLVKMSVDRSNPREWYYALMDYGVLLKQRHPNPGRRSRHYTRQSAFMGSNRQLRSALLRTVMEQPGITRTQLLKERGQEQESIERNLEAMVREGFLETHGDGYRIAGSKTEVTQ